MGTVDCRIAPLSGEERERGAVITSEADWMITLPAETAIETDDRIESSAAARSTWSPCTNAPAGRSPGGWRRAS